MSEVILILGFAGSLRRGSYNRALLRNAAELMPDGASLRTFDLKGIPAFKRTSNSARPNGSRNSKTESERRTAF
jgi:chromate reductase